MPQKKELPETIDEYISSCAPEIQPLLKELRSAIRAAAPEAGEKISWGMATFTQHGNLVHFSAEKRHIGFHPAPEAIEQFKDELSSYKTSKGTVQLPYGRPLPLELISRMVRFRVMEQEKAAEKKKNEKELRPRHPMPEDIKNLLTEEGLMKLYNARPPYQQNDYIGWINRAKRQETREKRIKQMADELRGMSAYMGMAYKAR